MDESFYAWGEAVSQDQLTIPRVWALAEAVDRFPFATLLDVRRKDDREGLIVEFQVELPQRPPVPILNRERIAIVLSPDENDVPKAYALRKDFPDTLHQNLTPPNEPKDLCLFEAEYREIKAQLTPMMLLQRVADWLARAAVEELHPSDQPLEPLLVSSGRIIFDPDLLDLDPEERPTIVVRRVPDSPSLLLRAYRLPKDADQRSLPDEVRYLLLPLTAPPWHSRLLSHGPQNLLQLCRLVSNLQVDLEEQIRAFITDLRQSGHPEGYKGFQLIILLQLPKTRIEGGPIESIEWWAFLILASIEDLAIRLGIMAKSEGVLGVLLGEPQSGELDKVQVIPLRPTFTLSKPLARLLSGLPENDPDIMAIGAGALGSQVILNLARQGFGTWTVVDYDHLLPHNLARHALFGYHECLNKAQAIALEMQRLFDEDQAARGFPFDILKHREENNELSNTLGTCDVILDFSTSRAVARALALADYPAGRICAFLSPTGQYLIVLSEGQERQVRLDDLELQLASAIAENHQFRSVYGDVTGSIPYAGSCRDASVQLAQDVVAIHAALASQFIKANILTVEPSINLWEWSSSNLSVAHHSIPVHEVTVVEENGWTIRISSHVGNLMRYYRRRHLPNETGGVLLGKIDYERCTVYVTMAPPSPPDSVEWPTIYIRGVQGLREEVEMISRVTGGGLSYVGEWHSHPVGCGSAPSEDDLKAHRWLVKEMGAEGLPGLIAIQGDHIEPHFLIATDT